MNKFGSQINQMKVGLIAGIVGPWIGFCLYGLYFAHKYYTSFHYFVNEAFLGTRTYQSPIATLSLLFNLVLFLLALRFNGDKFARGVLTATGCYVPLIVFLYFY